MSAPQTEPRPSPKSPTDLFVSFTVMALQGFGGVLTVVQRELVEKKRWMTREEFVEEWAVAQIMPGPNVCNLALMIGARAFGLRGAIAALAGVMTAPMVLVLTLGALYAGVAQYPAAQGALRGMGAAAAGLITATGLKLITALRKNPMGLAVCYGLAIATFIAIAIVRIPLVWVLLGLGLLACTIAYRRLGAAPGERP